MYSLIFLILFAAASFAQYHLGTDIKQLGLTFQFDQFISLLRNDPLTAEILNGPSKVTIIVPFNIPIDTFLPRLLASPSTEANQAAIANVRNKQRLSNLLCYLILNGTYPAASLPKGWSFPPSSLHDPKTFPLSKPAAVGVFSDATNFFIRTGNNFTSNVMIKDIPFSNGLIHAVDFPLAPPANISATGLSIGNNFLRALATALPAATTLEDITIFAPRAKFPRRNVRFNDYIVAGKIAYSTLLKDGTVLTARSGKKLVVRAKSSGEVFVNGVRIVSVNTLVSNGVVHFLERPF